MRYLTILILFIFSSTLLFGQTSISGIIQDAPDTISIFLKENIGGNYQSIDSCEIDKEGHFYFNESYPTGYYALWLSENNWIQLIINQEEDSIQFGFDSHNLREDIQILKSENNQKLWSFIAFRKQIMAQISDYEIKKSYAIEDDEAILDVQKQIDSLQKTYNEYLLYSYETKPSSFLSRTIISDYQTEDKSKFFIYTFFDDAALIRSGVFTHKVMEYLQKHTEYTEAGFSKSVDEILDQAILNSEVYEFILNYLLELFNEVGPDVILDYLIENYVIGDACSDLSYSEALNAKLGAYKKLQIGNRIANVSLFNQEGIMMNLHDICSFSNINILFFGSSSCHFCEEAIPQLEVLSSNYPNESLKIIYISMDEDAELWKSSIKGKSPNWAYLSELKGWKSISVALFQVHKTPSFYILDSQSKIISKPKSAKELSKDLEVLFLNH